MSDTKFTPGPWYETGTGNHQGLIVAEKTGENIAVVYDKVNARLIAAAPELLDALQAIMAVFHKPDVGWTVDGEPTTEKTSAWIQARAIIAKVEGK